MRKMVRWSVGAGSVPGVTLGGVGGARSTTEKEDFENFSNYLWSFRTRMPFVARIYCDEQYFYWAARFAFGNKRGN